jgi:hypothetical protein
MSRRLAAAAAASLALGALVIGPMTSTTPAVGASPSLTDAQVATLEPTKPMKGRAWIEGVAKDQFGNRLGNVTVTAVSADDEGAAITYEEPGIAGSTGFYRIYDLTPGTYTVKFAGTKPKVKPFTTTVTVGKRDIGQADAALTRVLADTSTTAVLTKGKITTKDKGSVVVTVKTGGSKTALGDVEVREGRKVVGTASLVKSDKGKVTVTLDKLPQGDHELKAHFLGNEELKASSSGALTLHVIKKKG